VGLGLVSLGGLISNISLVGIIGLSLISQYGLIGFICLGISLIGIYGQNGDISLIGLGIILSACWLIDFIGLGIECLISLVGLNSHISLVGLGCFSGWHAREKKKMWYSDNNATAIPDTSSSNKNEWSCHQNYQCGTLVWYYCTAYYSIGL
jgi:hypothetical protein